MDRPDRSAHVPDTGDSPPRSAYWPDRYPSVAVDGSHLARIVASVRCWDDASTDPDYGSGLRGRSGDGERVVIDQAKGAVMLRYGVNSHVALGILVCWSRGLDIPLDQLAHALAHGSSAARGSPLARGAPPAP